MHEISDEQAIILHNVREGNNVIVNAVAGSGKSTTILSIAKDMPELRILQITYNSKLKKEFKEKTESEGLKNVEVHTYHSFATKYYLSDAYNDIKIRSIITDELLPTNNFPVYDLIVLDEVQDCTLLYFRFVTYCIKCMNIKVQMLFLGDQMQMIYEFKGADSRFLTQADEIWKGSNYLKSHTFVFCTLNTSYRITNQMSSFINNAMLGEECVLSCKDGVNVEYIRKSGNTMVKIVVNTIKTLIKDGANPDDFFIIAGSLRSPSMIHMENALTIANIPCHFPMTDVVEVNDKIIDGKVAFVTCHTSKGRQRKYVFVDGFDNNYFNYYARTLDRLECPNTLYVATTRATTGLFLLEYSNFADNRSLEFLKMNHYDMKDADYVNFNGETQGIYRDSLKIDPLKMVVRKTTPTDLVRFMSEAVMETVSPIIDRIFVKITLPEDEFNIDIPGFIPTKMNYFEEVSNINGIAIPVIYYDHISKMWGGAKNNIIDAEYPVKNILYEIIEMKIADMKSGKHLFLKEIFADMKPSCSSISEYLYMANVFSATEEQLYFKLKQISKEEHTWITEDMITECKTRLDKYIGVECVDEMPLFEESIIRYNMDFEHTNIDAVLAKVFGIDIKFRFSARTDIITTNCIWELKCTTSISIENLLQTVIYAWLWRLLPHKNPLDVEKSVKIFNIKSGELFQLNASMDELNEIVIMLLHGKYDVCEPVCDVDFVDNCRNYVKT